jgi:cell division protein FtsB
MLGVMARVSYRVRWAATLVLVVALLFFFVFPTRSLLGQRSELRDAEQQLQTIEQENARLAHELQELGTRDEIRMRAREEFGLVEPGEQPYVPIPAPTTTTPQTPQP